MHVFLHEVFPGLLQVRISNGMVCQSSMRPGINSDRSNVSIIKFGLKPDTNSDF